jgi:hypothetical protein
MLKAIDGHHALRLQTQRERFIVHVLIGNVGFGSWAKPCMLRLEIQQKGFEK